MTPLRDFDSYKYLSFQDLWFCRGHGAGQKVIKIRKSYVALKLL